MGAPLMMTKQKKEGDETLGPLAFTKYFNKELAHDTGYFKSLEKFMNCVEKNAQRNLTEREQDLVCAKEYKELRLQAFEHQLLY